MAVPTATAAASTTVRLTIVHVLQGCHSWATAHTLVYRLSATNVESSTDLGLQTLGPDNVLQLTVRVS